MTSARKRLEAADKELDKAGTMSMADLTWVIANALTGLLALEVEKRDGQVTDE